MKKKISILAIALFMINGITEARFYCPEPKVFVNYRENKKVKTTAENQPDAEVLGFSFDCSGWLCDKAPSNPSFNWNLINQRWQAWWKTTNKSTDAPELISISLQCKDNKKTFNKPLK